MAMLIHRMCSATRRAARLPAVVRACLVATVLVAGLGGCAVTPLGIADLERYPQDATRYLQAGAAETLLIPPEVQARLDARYNERFFAPWQQKKASIPAADAFWGVASFGRKQGYAENLLPLDQAR